MKQAFYLRTAIFISILAASVISTENEVSLAETLKADILEYFTGKLEPHGFSKEGDEIIIFKNPDKTSEIEVQSDGETVNIYLRNEYESQEISLTNIDFKTQCHHKINIVYKFVAKLAFRYSDNVSNYFVILHNVFYL